MIAYCDYIAHNITTALDTLTRGSMLAEVSKPKRDLNSHGSLVSTRKTIEVTDFTGKKYRVTVEEI